MDGPIADKCFRIQIHLKNIILNLNLPWDLVWDRASLILKQQKFQRWKDNVAASYKVLPSLFLQDSSKKWTFFFYTTISRDFFFTSSSSSNFFDCWQFEFWFSYDIFSRVQRFLFIDKRYRKKSNRKIYNYST